MGLAKMSLCGHSLGGYVAAKYACKYPDTVRSLLLLSPGGVWPPPKGDLSNKVSFVKGFNAKIINKFWVPGRSDRKSIV